MFRLGCVSSLVACFLTAPLFARDQGPLPFDEGMLVHESEAGDTKVWLQGRVYLDSAFYSGSLNELANGFEIRRARLGFTTQLWTDWAAEIDVGFEDDEVEIKDAWLAYTGIDSTLVKVGHFKEPFSLEELTSSRYITFMERALPNVFAPGRHLGAAYAAWGERWYFSGGFFGEEAGEVDETGKDEGYGASARFTVAPVRRNGRVVHLGLSGALRTPEAGSEDRVRFRVRPETHVNRERFLNTGRINDVDRYNLLGLEAAVKVSSLSFQGEYIQSDVRRLDGLATASFDGWYAYVSWFPGGDQRPYVSQVAEFGRVVPKTKRGALELALRFSTVDLNDLEAGVTGGSSEITTLGLNWYANPNIRFMLNLSQVDNDELADADGDGLPNDSFEVVQARFQVHF